MNRRVIGFVVAALVIVVAIVAVVLALTAHRPKPTPKLLPTATPSPAIHNVEDLYQAERNLNQIDLDRGQEVITKNRQDISGTK